MDSASIGRLESSFAFLAPRGEELVDRFYGALFAGNPVLRAMFPRHLGEQKKRLLASIVLVMKNLRTPAAVRQPLLELGRRHADYGTKEEHYGVVRDTLIGVMADMAGSAWNQTLQEDWTAALNAVASIMIEGQRQAAATPTASSSAN